MLHSSLYPDIKIVLVTFESSKHLRRNVEGAVDSSSQHVGSEFAEGIWRKWTVIILYSQHFANLIFFFFFLLKDSFFFVNYKDYPPFHFLNLYVFHPLLDTTPSGHCILKINGGHSNLESHL